MLRIEHAHRLTERSHRDFLVPDQLLDLSEFRGIRKAAYRLHGRIEQTQENKPGIMRVQQFSIARDITFDAD